MFDVELWLVCACTYKILFCVYFSSPLPPLTTITMCGENRKFQSWLCLWLHALLCPHTLIANLKFMLHVVTEYNVTTDILWPFYFPSHMIYYINFYVLYHVSFFFFLLCSFFMLWECNIKKAYFVMLKDAAAPKKQTILLIMLMFMCINTTIHSVDDKDDDDDDTIRQKRCHCMHYGSLRHFDCIIQ